MASSSSDPKRHKGDESDLKRHRGDESYLPPPSGSSVDSLSTNVVLPYPKITPQLPLSEQSMWEREDIQVNNYLASVYKSGFIEDSHGVSQKFKDTTNPLQGRHLYNLVMDNKFTRTAEIGLAMGASAAWICQAHATNNLGGLHVAIDPNQATQYDNMGRTLVSRCGLADHLELMEMTSYRALPALFEDVRSGKIPKFHLIYIDGWHTFDYTLVDFFFADLLLEVNGVIVLDDIKHRPVQSCLRYIKANYLHYKLVPETPCFRVNDFKFSSQATFIKVANDNRVWNAHVDF